MLSVWLMLWPMCWLRSKIWMNAASWVWCMELRSPRGEESPLAFPPFLGLMKTRRENIKTSISRESTSHVFWWISTHVQSPAISWDHTAEPYQDSSEDSVNKTTWLSLTGNALTHTGNTSVLDHVIFQKNPGWIVSVIMITSSNLSRSKMKALLIKQS